MAEILHQLRLVVYPIIYRVSYIPGGARFQPSTVCHLQYIKYITRYTPGVFVDPSGSSHYGFLCQILNTVSAKGVSLCQPNTIVGGFSPTHFKNMRKSNWIISQGFGVNIKHI